MSMVWPSIVLPSHAPPAAAAEVVAEGCCVVAGICGTTEGVVGCPATAGNVDETEGGTVAAGTRP